MRPAIRPAHVALVALGSQCGVPDNHLVDRCESDLGERIEQGQHQRPIVAPGARGLFVSATATQLDGGDLDGRHELVRDPDGIAHQVSPHGRRATAHELSCRFSAGTAAEMGAACSC